MRISRVKVHNYRNIDGIEVLLNPECNYIIGENNLGKSNFLANTGKICCFALANGIKLVDASSPDTA